MLSPPSGNAALRYAAMPCACVRLFPKFERGRSTSTRAHHSPLGMGSIAQNWNRNGSGYRRGARHPPVSPRRKPGPIFQRPVLMDPGFRRGDSTAGHGVHRSKPLLRWGMRSIVRHRPPPRLRVAQSSSEPPISAGHGLHRSDPAAPPKIIDHRGHRRNYSAFDARRAPSPLPLCPLW
jgi:hypothetical protein